MSQGNELLRAILMNPKCDTTRLVYADWLQENGDPERAEFIRLQVAGPKGNRVDYLHREWRLFEKIYRRIVPIDLIRKSKSSRRNCDHIISEAPTNLGHTGMEVRVRGYRSYSEDQVATFRIYRGFVGAVIMPPATFMRRCKNLLSYNPIMNASLTSFEPHQSNGYITIHPNANSSREHADMWGADFSSEQRIEIPREVWENIPGSSGDTAFLVGFDEEGEPYFDYEYQPIECGRYNESKAYRLLAIGLIRHGRKQAGLM
jgi:uncharacterized protein (TIGR02996 family)